MKNYAVIENDLVVNVVVAEDEWVDGQTGEIVEYTDENPAFIGGTFVGGYFYKPQPYESWTRLEGEWIPPKPMPGSVANGFFWFWNEEIQDWEEIEIPEI